jgi:glutathionylspermidine synthase
MQRITIEPRQGWSAEASSRYSWHTPTATPGWHEDVYYKLTPDEAEELRTTAERCHRLVDTTVERAIRERLWPIIGIEQAIGDKIKAAWDDELPGLLSRIDFIYEAGFYKMIDYNAESTTGLMEASILQKLWRDAQFPNVRQFNDIHPALVQRLNDTRIGRTDNRFHVTADSAVADATETVRYVGACAQEAGYRVAYYPLGDTGVQDEWFYDMTVNPAQPLVMVYKCYPWEGFVTDRIGGDGPNAGHLYLDHVNHKRGSWWLEPIWRMAYQCNGLLPLVWETFVDDFNLLNTSRAQGDVGPRFVRKPVWARDSMNIQVQLDGKIVSETVGERDAESYIYQTYGESTPIDGHYTVFSVWLVRNTAVGLGIREGTDPIVRSNGRFAPHIIE